MSNFQVNIFSNNRYYKTLKFLHADADEDKNEDDATAVTMYLNQDFLGKRQEQNRIHLAEVMS